MKRIRIVLFDDNAHLRDSIGMLIAEDATMELVAAFADCNNLEQIIQATNPDVVMMDIDMPGMDGIEAVRLLRNSFPDLRVLMQTVFEDDKKVFAALRNGANGYILKNSEPERVLSAITDTYFGGSPFSPAIAKKVLAQFRFLQESTPQSNHHLSHRELEVLALMVQGCSLKMIGAKLYIAYDTVRSHVKKIYEKLHVTSMTEAVALAIRHNMV